MDPIGDEDEFALFAVIHLFRPMNIAKLRAIKSLSAKMVTRRQNEIKVLCANRKSGKESLHSKGAQLQSAAKCCRVARTINFCINHAK
jgi:hypothetical protein